MDSSANMWCIPFAAAAVASGNSVILVENCSFPLEFSAWSRGYHITEPAEFLDIEFDEENYKKNYIEMWNKNTNSSSIFEW